MDSTRLHWTVYLDILCEFMFSSPVDSTGLHLKRSPALWAKLSPVESARVRRSPTGLCGGEKSIENCEVWFAHSSRHLHHSPVWQLPQKPIQGTGLVVLRTFGYASPAGASELLLGPFCADYKCGEVKPQCVRVRFAKRAWLGRRVARSEAM